MGVEMLERLCVEPGGGVTLLVQVGTGSEFGI
jgi:hypothetical protein